MANPFSGSGPNGRRVQRLLAALRARGMRPEPVWDPAERRAWLADPELADHCRCVIAAGGDGSLSDMVNDLSAGGRIDRVPIAAWPLGNENLFARHYGFRAKAEELATAIDAGHTRSVDLGVANGRRFVLMTGLGFDAAVVHRVARWRQASAGALRRVNRLSYGPHMLGAWLKGAFEPLVVETETGERHVGAHLIVFNLPEYGGRLPLMPAARGDDGRLHWLLFREPGRMRLISYGLSVLMRRHLRRADVAWGSGRTLEVTSRAPIPMQLDGDPAGHAPVTFGVEPGAMRIVRMPLSGR